MSRKQPTSRRDVHFEGYEGVRISGSLDFPQQQAPLAYAIACHCFTCTRQTLTTARVSKGLAEAGIAVLRFDFTGLGESEGDFAHSHFTSMLGDIQGAARFLQSHYQAPSFLLGHSMGGTACLAASQLADSSLSQLRKLVTLASPAAPNHVLHHFGKAMPELRAGRMSSIQVAGQTYPVAPSFVEDVENFDMRAQMAQCVLPILAIRAGEDALVPASEAEAIIRLTRGQSKLMNIDGADHLFSHRPHTQQLLDGLIPWLLN